MPIVVKRYGGMMPAPPKIKTTPWEEIDEATRDALKILLAGGDRRTAQPVPDTFSYTFESDQGADAGKKVTVSGMIVPDALRKLLP